MKYLNHYPKDLQDKIKVLIEKEKLSSYIKQNIQLLTTSQMTKTTSPGTRNQRQKKSWLTSLQKEAATSTQTAKQNTAIQILCF